jgi:hypothetical protein
MAATEKALQISKDLKDLFAKQVYSTMPIITESFDSSGYPVLTISADVDPATTEKVVVVVVKPFVTGTQKDVFGNTANTYGPHVIQFCTEANYAATTDNIADYLTPVELLPIICEIAKRGCITEWHVTANGTVPSATAIAAGTVLKATWKPLYWGVQSAS